MKKNGVGWDLLFVYLRHVGLLLLAIFLGYKLYRLAPWRQSSPFFSETMDTAHRASAESDFVYNQMYQLAMSYFKPEWLTDGINKTHFESLAAAAIIPHTSRNATVIVQVINSTIWVDRTGWNTPFSWDHMRAHFILGLLQQLLTKAVLPDFEFILNTHDCPMRNFSRGPVLGITGCQSVQTIPLPQWYRWRDGAFANWDQRMAQHYFKATSVPWTEKQSKAVFRGVLRPSCLQFDEQRGLHFVNITSKNWRTASRTKLWHLGTQHPDLFDVGIVHERSNQHQAILLGAMGAQPAERLAMEDQSMKFKYVVYIEGACGWADRLKNLLAAGMLIFMQKTPCQEFFAPLLRPMVHYVPVRNDLGDLVEKIRWVQENDNEAREIAANAADFAATWLTQAAWMAYAEAVFRIYAGLPKAYKTVRQPGAVLFKKPTNCPQRNDHYCDTSKSFGALSKP